MALFGTTRPQATPSTTTGSTDALFCTALTNRKMKFNEFSLIGNGSTSAAAAYLEYGMKTATGAAGAAGTAITPTKFEADSAASVCFTNHSVTTDATAGVSSFVIGCNLYGGIYRWTARPNGEHVIRNIAATGAGASGSLCIRQTTALTSGTYTLHTIWDEL
jgi:hypothetical protein